jgi:type I site-specific restriction endonuclease
MDRRPYQEEAVKAARGAVKKHRNTLMIAATGLGKTAMSGFFLEDEFKAEPDSKALFVQNTEELLQQNMTTGLLRSSSPRFKRLRVSIAVPTCRVSLTSSMTNATLPPLLARKR